MIPLAFLNLQFTTVLLTVAQQNQTVMRNLYTEISNFQAQGKVLLCGDFNAWTGVEPDLDSHLCDSHQPP